MFQQLKTSFLYSPIPDSVPILKFRSTDEVSPLFLQRPAYQVGIITVMMIDDIPKFDVQSCNDDTKDGVSSWI